VPAPRVIAAAGGVVWRGGRKNVEVGLVHRPRYDDWTLPKGKLDAGESELAGAVREVREEVGAEVAVSRRIGRVSYDVDGMLKSVTYWVMRELNSVEFVPSDEIDEIEWLSAGKARKRLTYTLDKHMLDDFLSMPAPDSLVVLVRHAKAGKRSEWRGKDALRPLEITGQRQARQVVSLLLPFRPTAVISAGLTRCQQTVEPLAKELGLQLTIDPAFEDERFARSPDATLGALLALAKPGAVSVVCSQGETIPGLVDRLSPKSVSSETRKAGAWVLSFVDGEVVAADYYDEAAGA
jgi:8-oxo-(d)GTP phosphatase